MARKKRGIKKHRGRRRVSGPGKDAIMEFVGALAFMKFGGKVTSMLPSSLSPTIVGAAELGGGFLLLRKTKNPLLRGVGLGAALAGGSQLLTSFGIAGVGAPGAYPSMSTIGNFEFKRVAGVSEDMNGLGGVGNEMSVISGLEDYDDMEGYGDDD